MNEDILLGFIFGYFSALLFRWAVHHVMAIVKEEMLIHSHKKDD